MKLHRVVNKSNNTITSMMWVFNHRFYVMTENGTILTDSLTSTDVGAAFNHNIHTL